MPSLSNINKRDETASKPDTGKYGLEPFMGASGYAMVVCCPIYTVIGIVGSIVHKVKKRRLKKAQERDPWERPPSTDNDRSGENEKRGGEKTENSTSPGIKRVTSPPKVTHGFKGDPENPRICHPECPGYLKDHCAAHDKSDPDRPTSPGMLAV